MTPESGDKENSRTPGVHGSDSSIALEQLLEGYDLHDQAAVSEVCIFPHFQKFLTFDMQSKFSVLSPLKLFSYHGYGTKLMYS